MRVRRANDKEMRDGAKRSQMFYGLMRRAVFAKPYGIVREDVDDLNFGKSCASST